MCLQERGLEYGMGIEGNKKRNAIMGSFAMINDDNVSWTEYINLLSAVEITSKTTKTMSL